MTTDIRSFTLMQLSRILHSSGIEYDVSALQSSGHYSFKSIHKIEPRGIYFLLSGVKTTQPINDSLVICANGSEEFGQGNIFIRVAHPKAVYYQLMQQLVAPPPPMPGIHSTAVVHPEAVIGKDVTIDPYCVVGKCVIGAGVHLHSHVTIMEGSVLEDEVTVRPHTTIGVPGYGWTKNPETNEKIIQPQIGGVRIKTGAVIGSHVVIDRAIVNEDTEIGKGSFVGSSSTIAHGTVVGNYCYLSQNTMLTGNVTLGDDCFVGAGVVVRPNTKIAARTIIGAGAVVVKHVEQEGLVVAGNPAVIMPSHKRILSGVPS